MTDQRNDAGSSGHSAATIVFRSPIDWLLLAVPAAFAVRYVPSWDNPALLFAVAGIGIIPLAAVLGRATDALAARSGPAVGAVVNATFGNAAELIIGFMALSKGLTGVVKASLTGSIIGNMLLVFGASALAGGLRYRTQTFDKRSARAGSTSLGLAGIAVIVPTVFHRAAEVRPGGWSAEAEQRLSLAIAAVLIVTYVLTLIFFLVTHRVPVADEGLASEERPPALWLSLTMLTAATVLIGFLSEYLVDSIQAARQSVGFTETFVGVIVVAIVGNAAEHATAVTAALRNKMDLSLSIAANSSTQVALFVAPLLLFASHFIGHPMTLEFSLPEVVAIGLAVWIVTEIAGDGETNWLEGVQLLSVYLILAILFFFLPDAAHR